MGSNASVGAPPLLIVIILLISPSQIGRVQDGIRSGSRTRKRVQDGSRSVAAEATSGSPPKKTQCTQNGCQHPGIYKIRSEMVEINAGTPSGVRKIGDPGLGVSPSLDPWLPSTNPPGSGNREATNFGSRTSACVDFQCSRSTRIPHPEKGARW